ncbi:hypothetical protein ACUWC3_28405, partial [Klebsiella pneumoniae]|uniref:hypothetical protein n=2 Tax=Klebsiella pneumoniae TaxID=573 RepID=UPI0040555A42
TKFREERNNSPDERQTKHRQTNGTTDETLSPVSITELLGDLEERGAAPIADEAAPWTPTEFDITTLEDDGCQEEDAMVLDTMAKEVEDLLPGEAPTKKEKTDMGNSAAEEGTGP